jgi:hypothetical protein
MCAFPSKETVLQREALEEGADPELLEPLLEEREPLIEFFAAWSLRLRHERVGVDVPVIEALSSSSSSS